MIANKVVLLFVLLNLDYSNCINVCNDWIQYKDIKCIKVLQKKATEDEALNTCTKLDQSSILLTIHSKDEQEYLNSLLEKYNNISVNVWLGMKYTEKAFKWMDGTNTEFNNWSEDAVKNGNDPCVEMSLQKETFGKWDAVPCIKKALIVCQKKQEFNLNTLKSVLENMTKIFEEKFSSQENKIQNLTKVIVSQEIEVKDLKKEINELKTNSLKVVNPIGFLYTQLPNQTSPQELWPNMKWIEVTKDYSGLFFRAEGGESLPFGQTQQANQSWFSHVSFDGVYYDSWTGSGRHANEVSISLEPDKWTVVSPADKYDRAIGYLEFYTTGGEVRPKNTAIRIFKRIQ